MCAPSAPDTSGLNAAALKSSQISQEALDWFKQAYADQAPARAQTADLDKRVGEANLASMQFATNQAQEQAARSKSTFQPIEDQLASTSQAYDTPERRAAAAASATANVEGTFGRAQEGVTRDIMRHGGTVGGVGGQALMQDAALQKAQAITGATTDATRNVEAQGHAQMMDAAGIGRGVVGNQATQQNIATNEGAGAVSASGAGLGATMAGNGVMQQGFSTGLQGQATAGQLYGQEAGIQAQTRGQDLNFLTNALQSAPALYKMYQSSKKVKKNTNKPADTGKALDEVDSLDVKDGWQYDPSKGGVDDGGIKHTGPMAEQVRAKMGDDVAPGGKAIDVVSMNGKLIASMQNLSKRVKKLEGVKTPQEA